ncbi:MAG: hypothetical protein GXO79_07315 [Chlorobi bacterium]|nr:hypothetical protein [Chlorobiota bacterium]
MKKLFLGAGIILAVITITFFSCNKEEQLAKQQNVNEQSLTSYELPTILTEGVSNKNGLLKFRDQKTFDKVIKTLEEENIRWNTLFEEKWKGLSDEEFEDKEEKTNFKENLVYEEFENHFSHHSLRAKIYEQEEIWLSNEELDFEHDPDNIAIIGDELRTVLNEDAEIMIGNSIYKIIGDWVIYEITDGNFETLYKLRDDDKTIYKNVVIHNQETESKSCYANKHRTNYINYRTNRMAKIRVTITNSTFGHFAKAETTSYKKKKRRWVKYKTSVKARIFGHARDTDCKMCDDPKDCGFDPGTVSKTAKYVKAKYPFGSAARAQDGEIGSYHYVDGWSTEFVLQ